MLKTHLKLVHISHHTALCSSVLWGYSKRTREKRDQSQQNTDVKIVKKYSVSLQQAVQSMLADSKLLGSNIASELGTMRVTQQIDALEIMGVNSAEYLILPKITAMVTMMPFLVIFSSAMGIVGAYATAYIGHVLPPDDLTLGLTHDFVPWFLWMSIIKSLVFAFIISSLSKE